MRNLFLAALLLISPLAQAGVEFGTADQVMRVPSGVSGSYRGKYGSIDLSKTAAVGTSILAAANGGTGIAYAANPSGMIFPFAGTTCPTGSLAANGTSLLRSGGTACGGGSCAALFTAIGITWGTVDGTHFTVPDLRERGLKGTGTNIDGNGGTVIALGAYQGDATAKNGLTLSDPGHQHLQTYPTATGAFANYGNSTSCTFTSCANGTTSGGIGTSSAISNVTLGTGDAETRVKTYGVTYCLWY